MISSASSPDRAPRADPVVVAGTAAPKPFSARPDQLSTAGAAFLRAELARQPAVRPEVVARGRALAADPGYPPPSVMKAMAQAILASPDLSDDES